MSGLVGWWPLHDANATDLSGNGYHGTVSGATPGVAGKGGLQAMSFDGVDDAVTVNLGSTVQTMASLSFVVYRDPALTGGGSTGEALWSDTAQVDEFIALGDVTSNTSSETVYISSTGDGATYTTESLNDGWNHVAVVWDGSAYAIYINGTAATRTAHSVQGHATQMGSTDIALGGRTENADLYLTGKLADVRIYDRSLSAEEVQTLYEWAFGDYVTPTTEGGVSYWPLDEDSGTTAVDQWGTNDGATTGAAVGVSGVRDTAYNFDGVDDVVAPPSFTFNAHTVSAWIHADGVTNVGSIFGADEGGSGGTRQFQFRVSNGSLEYIVLDANAATSSVSEPISTGTWYHVCATNDSANQALYLNGDRVAEGSLTTKSDAPNIRIGARYNHLDATNSDFFDGKIDDVRFYNRALSPAEVHDLYRYGTRGRDLRELTVEA